MAVFFGVSPLALRTAATRPSTSAQAAVADLATMGSSRPSSADSLNSGLPSSSPSPRQISWTHLVRGPFGSSQRMYWRVVRYPTGRTYAAEWNPGASGGWTDPRCSRVTPWTGPTGSTTFPSSPRGSVDI